MQTINFVALIPFVLVTTFTPGPNNISSSSMGILYGYRQTINYLLGISLGFFIVMFLSGLISQTLYDLFPKLEPTMRIVGAGYILWLAYKTLKSSYQLTADATSKLDFRDGLLLQAFNPKVWVYGLTLYAAFLSGIAQNGFLLIISALLLAGVSFSSISTWTFSGTLLRRLFHKSHFQKTINIILALLLAYTAIELSGLV